MAQEQEKVVAPSLSSILASYSTFITYVPLRTEVSALDLFPLPKGATSYQIAPRAALDPNAEAKAAIQSANGRPTCIFMPGRLFDAHGTRHGQGGGWYDRFLALVPAEWLRVGFCFDTQFSNEKLVRQSWDQPMDFVCVVTKETSACRAIRTNARGGALVS